MDFARLWEYAQQAIRQLGHAWEIKVGMTAMLAAIQLHAELFFLFVILIALDLLTKWIALSRPLCTCLEPSIWHELRAIPEAHRQGLINSDMMKTRFIGKIIVYLLLAAAAGTVDMILREVNKDTVFTALCIGYLAATELLSIIENLNDAGVSAVADLLAIIKRVRGK